MTENRDDDQSKQEEDDEITKREEQEAHERTAVQAHVVALAVVEEGEMELKRSSISLFWSGLAAGLSMGFSMVAEGLLEAFLPHAQKWTVLVAKFGYSIGFLIVVLGRQQLFTENTLTAMLPLFHNRQAATIGNVARLWLIVLVANLVGATIFAYAVAHTDIFDAEAKAAFLEQGMAGMAPPFLTVFLRGIFAGWLIALMVWLLPAAETARVWVIIIITYIVGIGHMAHIIAGSIDAIFTVAMHHHTWGEYFTRFMFPALFGNIVGGVALVAALNFAQIPSEKVR